MKNKHRKSSSSVGVLDNYAIRAEEYASYATRTKRPPNVTCHRIMGLVEKAQNYQHTYMKGGVEYDDNRPYRKEAQESQRKKIIARIWAAYEVVQKTELMHPSKKGKDCTWNGAKRNDNGDWVPEPVYYYGDEFEHVVADELHGMKAQGRTPIRNSNYNGDEGGSE